MLGWVDFWLSADRSTFYTQDPIVGYTDYPFLDEDNHDSTVDA
jgi:12-oxophytodienoic acid reductase